MVRFGLLAVLAACPAPARLRTVHVTTDAIYDGDQRISGTDPRSMCEDCRYVDALLELLSSEPTGSVVRVEVDPGTAATLEQEVLFTISLAHDDALVHYNIFAK